MTPDLPRAVRRFIEDAIVAGDVALPFHYPRPEHWQGWQSGFRYHGITGESLIATTPGEWQPGWHVIALNGFDDPFFIDLGEEAQGFPIYYAPHGAGRWNAGSTNSRASIAATSPTGASRFSASRCASPACCCPSARRRAPASSA